MKYFIFGFLMLALGACKHRNFSDVRDFDNEKDDGLSLKVPDKELLAECSSFTTEHEVEYKKGKLQIWYSAARSRMQSERWSAQLGHPVKLAYLLIDGFIGLDGRVSALTNKPVFLEYDVHSSLSQPPLVLGVKDDKEGFNLTMFNRTCEVGKSCDNTISLRSDDGEFTHFKNINLLILGRQTVLMETDNSFGKTDSFRFSKCDVEEDVLRAIKESL